MMQQKATALTTTATRTLFNWNNNKQLFGWWQWVIDDGNCLMTTATMQQKIPAIKTTATTTLFAWQQAIDDSQDGTKNNGNDSFFTIFMTRSNNCLVDNSNQLMMTAMTQQKQKQQQQQQKQQLHLLESKWLTMTARQNQEQWQLQLPHYRVLFLIWTTTNNIFKKGQQLTSTK